MAKAIHRTICAQKLQAGSILEHWVLWRCETPSFTVALRLDREFGYKYDGEDEDGETQRALDCGELIAFTSSLSVTLKGYVDEDGIDLAWAYLGGSIYAPGKVQEFLKDGYFRGMLKEACDDARKVLAGMPRLRSI